MGEVKVEDADREGEKELTTLPLHCTEVEHQRWLTTKLTERKFPC